MRWLSLLLLPLLCGVVSSCGPDQPQPGAQSDGAREVVKNDTPRNTAAASSNRPINASAAAPAASNAEPAPIPPKGAQYTIFCRDFPGPMHVDYSNQAKSELLKSTKLRGWYVLHLEDHSSLMYGYYKSIDEKSAKADRAAIEQITDAVGNRVFKSCIVLPIDAPDPSAPPDWNLANLRQNESDTQHYWSLQIAAFRDNPQRKQAAVQMVKELRDQGVQSYYYHGESVSSVCVGCWPMSALKKQDAAVAAAGNPNPDQKVFVSPVPMPKNILRQYAQQGITVVQPEIEVVDPSMQEMMNRFPQHFVNYEPEPLQVNGKPMPKPSAIVPIPVKKNSMLSADPAAPPPSADTMRALSPNSGAGSTGTGRLKGVK
jgi:hypothetical protein